MYRAINAFYRSNPDPELSKRSDRDVLVLAGTELELDDELAKPYLESGAIQRVQQQQADQSESEQSAEPQGEGETLTEQQYAELVAQRPGNSASRENWLAYARTVPGLTVPDDAKRDEIVAAVDVRLDELQP